MTHVLLINSNQVTTPYPVYPLGLSYISSYLESKNISTTFFDCTVSDWKTKLPIYDHDYTCIGISIRNIDDLRIDQPTSFTNQVIELCDYIRSKTDTPIVLGGSGYSLFPEEFLTLTKANFGIIGEGEESFYQLICLLNSKSDSKNFDHIPGLVYKNDFKIISNKRIHNSLQCMDVHNPKEDLLSFYIHESGMGNVQTQRGCPFTCGYCTYPLIEGTHIRQREPEFVIDELERLYKTQVPYVFIVDSVFNTTVEHVVRFCEEKIKKIPQLPFGCFMRPSGFTKELAKLLKAAGLKHVEFGSDSFSDTVLESYGKAFTFEDILHSSQCLHEAKVHYAHFLILGGPGESEKTVQETFENSERLIRTVFFTFIGMRVFRDTPLYKSTAITGKSTDFSNYMDPIFYVSPEIDRSKISLCLNGFHKANPRWIIGDPSPENMKIMQGLRSKGIPGPLWEYLIR